MIKGVLYATAGTRRSVIAMDGKTGELMWAHSMREGNRAAIAPRQLSGRGLSYWTDGKGDDRVLYVTTGYRLVALNARNGAVITSFGKDGIVDLKEGMVSGTGLPIDLETGEAGLHSTPIVVKDTVIIGSSFKEGMTVVTHNNTKGSVRAFDVRTGKRLWTFNTIPKPGEFGNDTWENGSWATNGNTGVWTQMTVDEELDWSICQSSRPLRTITAENVRATICLARAWCGVDLKPDSANGISRSCTIPFGLRSFVSPNPCGHQRRRKGHQSRRAAEQGILLVCFRSRDGQAGLADRGASRSAVRRSW